MSAETIPAAGSSWAVDGGADAGFFGPGSVSWKVLAAPAVPMMIAQITHLLEATHVDFQSVLLDHDPLYRTNRKKQRSWRGNDPQTKGGRLTDRLRRTVVGPLPLIFGDRQAARRCADRLTAYHRPMQGTNPDDGQPYAAVDPETMLFAAITIAHGALLAYERFAFHGIGLPRRLPSAERDQFFAETAELAVLMGVPRDRVPVTARAVDEYYRSQAHKYHSRQGYFVNQIRTAATQFRSTTADSPASMAADVLMVASSLFAYSALPAPSRRLHHVPLIADPLLTACYIAALPLFGVLQFDRVYRPILNAFIGAENVDAIQRSQQMST